MKRPFKIFPSIGYRNSQFQIISSVDNLKVDIYAQNKIIKSIQANSQYPTILTTLSETGKLTAKCNFNNNVFEQELEVKEAFRLGSSEFKKSFVFDNTEYSFFLMKDRLLLYDEKMKTLLTENHYSPTEIHKINDTTFLFITKIGTSENEIINLGIYNTETFSLVGELLNNYREIKLLAENNKVWLYNMKSKTIHCFELTTQANKYLTELKAFEKFNDYFLDDINHIIYINHHDILEVSSLNNLNNSFEIQKKENNAIDKLGNVYTIENKALKCTSLHSVYAETVNPNFEVNLHSDNFIHIGKHLKSKDELTDLNRIAEEVKVKVIPSLPDDITFHYQEFSDSQKIFDNFTTHEIYPTKNGVFIIQKRTKRNFKGVIFKKEKTKWTATPYETQTTDKVLLFINSGRSEILINRNPKMTVCDYHNGILVVGLANSKILLLGRNKVTLNNEDSIQLFTINEKTYYIVESNKKHSLYLATNPHNAILERVEILNPDLFNKHQIIWYRGKDKNISNNKQLNAFDLKNCTKILINQQMERYSLFNDKSDFEFFENYALSSNQVLFSPATLEMKNAFIGKIESHSKQLNKIVSHLNNSTYLSKFNPQTGRYELSPIPIDNNNYRESYLSPNGQFLVLQSKSNKYSFYDIEKGETINFISGNFLEFRKDGSLIVEQNDIRAVKIIDPITFQDITPPNYHHYRFMSPDGKLYAQLSSKVRYIHKLNGKELDEEDVSELRQDLDKPTFYIQEKEKEKAERRVDKKRLQIFNNYKEQFQALGFEDYTQINSHAVVLIEQYTEIGITGTSVVKKIVLPKDTQFYNYASFSYDNRYLVMVFRLETGGGINFMKLNFDEKDSSLEILDTYLSRYPRYASWVCGISKTGFFATYDSTPDTYLINVDENLFDSKTTEVELQQNIYKLKTNIYHTYNKWNEIKGKNFLCFSPTGDFLALSEQGYEPLTLGGYGHQESNVVHIVKTASGQIIDSFTGHGDKIKYSKDKKVTFVAFSEDENRIMTLSSDGVVIIRDINISDNGQADKMPAASKHLTAMEGSNVQ